jgi:ABC-type uncharacterized transport system involved in gliding motility auxiliary subunit
MRRLERSTQRKLAFGGTLGAAALLVFALVGILNYLGFRHYWRWDWTRSQLYTLSEKTTSILEGLDKDVSVVVFMDEQSEVFEPTKELLARYAAASSRIDVSIIDPVRNLARAQQLVERYEVDRAAVVFESGGDKRVVDATDLADYDYSAMQMGGAPEMRGFKGEQLFTSAIVELVEAKKPTILFTTGHGEPSLDSMEGRGFGRLQRFLGQDNFSIEEWASLGKNEVPPATDLIVVAGPTQPFAGPELQLLGRYVEGGGRLLVMIDPNLTETGRIADTGLAGWLGTYGVSVGDDIVIDPTNLLPFFSAETIFAGNYGSHPITEALSQARAPVVFSLARSVRAAPAAPEGKVTELVRTSGDGWGETNLEQLEGVEKEEGDLPGPVGLGVAVEIGGAEAPSEEAVPLEGVPGPDGAAPTAAPTAGTKPQGRMVVYGDSDFATNAQLDQPGNATLIANTLNWMVERETHLGIAAKEPEQVRLSLTPQERRQALLLVVVFIPLATLITGIVVNVRRRR